MKQSPLSLFKSAFLTGFLSILPIGLLLLVLLWFYQVLTNMVSPIASWFGITHSFSVVLVIVGLLFFITLLGLLIHTTLGLWFGNRIEKYMLQHIPGYKTVKKIIEPFGGKKDENFKSVVLVQLFENSTLATGFVTDQTKDRVTVFVPTGPNPTSGQIFHVKKNFVHPVSASVDKVLSTTFAVGNGSADLIDKTDFSSGYSVSRSYSKKTAKKNI